MVDRRFGGKPDQPVRTANVEAENHVLFDDRLEHRIPVARQEAGPTLCMRRFEETDSPETLLAHPVNLLHRELDVPHWHDAQRDEATRVCRAPSVDVPV